MNFSERFKKLRTSSNLTQAQLAKELSITQRAVSYYEQGRLPDEETLKNIANYFDVSADYLLGLSDLRNPYKELENVLSQLEASQDSLIFDGEILDDETRELLKISLESSMKLAKQIAKKYTPKE